MYTAHFKETILHLIHVKSNVFLKFNPIQNKTRELCCVNLLYMTASRLVKHSIEFLSLCQTVVYRHQYQRALLLYTEASSFELFPSDVLHEHQYSTMQSCGHMETYAMVFSEAANKL